jgi:rare lipoprotein A
VTARRVVLAVGIALAVAAALPACTSSRPAGPTTSGNHPSGGALQVGKATWYATGTMTASGERFDKRAMTAAHRTLPFGTMVEVTHRTSKRRVTVRINDRGPFGSKQRIIDLSEAAGERLGIIDEGVAPVTVKVVRKAPPRKAKRRR